MPQAVIALLTALAKGFVEHKSSSAAGVAALAAATAVPMTKESGQFLIPTTMEEGAIQLAMAIVGIVLIYLNPKKKK
jgi:hypothetical protein